MDIESFTIKLPHVEVVYHYPPKPDNTVLQAPHQLLDEYCSRTYSYTIAAEYFDHQRGDLVQQTFSTDLPTWIDALTPEVKNDVARQFVSYCMSIDTTHDNIQFFE